MKAQSEDDFAQAVRDYAKLMGFMHYHTHRSDRSEPGFPDCVMVRGSRLIFAELKRDNAAPRVRKDVAEQHPPWLRGRAITEAQASWLEALRIVEVDVRRAATAGTGRPSVEVFVWKPADWPEIERVLAR